MGIKAHLKEHWKRHLFRLVALLVLITAIVFYIPKIDFKVLGEALREADLKYIFAAFCGVLALALSRSSLIWSFLRKLKLRWPFIVSVNIMGAMMDQLIPGRSGYLLRWSLISLQRTKSKSFIFSALISSAALEGMLLVILLFIILSFDENLRSMASMSIVLPLGLVVFGILGFFLFADKLKKLLRGSFLERWPVLQAFFDIAQNLKEPSSLALSVGFGALSWTIQILIVIGLGKAFGLSLSVLQSVVLLLAINLAIVIPIVPGNLGTIQLVITATLSKMHFDPSKSLAFAIAFHTIHMIPIMTIGGLLSLFYRPKVEVPEAATD